MLKRIFTIIDLIIGERATLPFVFFMLISCRSTDTDQSNTYNTNAVVKINVQGEMFDRVQNIENQATVSVVKPNSSSLIFQEEIPFNDDFMLIARVSSDVLPVQKATVSLSNISSVQADTEVSTVPLGIRYKLIVYKSTGEYITERNYIYGQESNTQALDLDGGNNYTFVVYSVNSPSTLPVVTFTNSQNKTLSTSSISGLSGLSDFMYFKKEMQLVGNQPNYLNVVFNHKFSQIITHIDASLSGYNVSATDLSYDSHFPTAGIKLEDAAITRTGTVGRSNIIFPTLNLSTIVSNPTIINGNTSTGSLVINSITIGSIVRTKLTAFANKLMITPGVKYNVTLNIVPTDNYLDYMGQKAVRINGEIWMRHNLGADTNLNPDQDPSVQGLHGNYYQWGEIQEVANAYTASEAISGWRGTGYPWKANNAWNGGTETSPVKVMANDPCPNGFRIPTKTEYDALIASTVQGNVGIWSKGEANFSAAKVFVSKRNKYVQLTFPAAGFRDAYAGSLFDSSYKIRGEGGYYRTSTANYEMSIYAGQIVLYSDVYKSWGESIRCIAV